MIRISQIIASAFGIGYLPLAPGTWASLAAAIVWFEFLIHFPSFQIWQWPLVIVAIVIGVISSEIVEKKWGKDPSKVVIDEVAGMWTACLLLPPKPGILIMAFIFFRFFDIVKPLGIRRLENLEGGWGIMADDVAAGICSNIVVHLVVLMFSVFSLNIF